MRGGKKEQEQRVGEGEGDGSEGFIGDVSIATARLIRRYELLLAA